MTTVSKTSGTTLNTPTFVLQGCQKKKRKTKVTEKIFEEIIIENFPNMERKSQSSPGSTERPIQDKSKEKHPKAHINPTYQKLNTKNKY